MKDWEKNLEEISSLVKENQSYAGYLAEKYSVYEYICVFGMGNIGIVTADRLAVHGIKVDFFCDNDKEKAGREYRGIPCFLPDKLCEIKDKTIVIISTRYYREIERQLIEMGIQHIDRVFANKYGVKDILKRYQPENVLNKMKETVNILADEHSKNAYTAVLKNWISLDYRQEEIDAVFSDDQYFCKDIFTVGSQEYFVDGGAYDGDTFQKFWKETKGEFCGADLFELSEVNYKKLEENINGYDLEIREKIHCINKGLSDKEGVINYCDNDEGSTVDNEGNAIGYLTSIDESCADHPVTYIKLDIEGSEKQALQGAEKIIRINKPRLAICLYHKFEDFWEIPLSIHKILPEYQIYIRHHTDLLNETVCYARV